MLFSTSSVILKTIGISFNTTPFKAIHLDALKLYFNLEKRFVICKRVVNIGTFVDTSTTHTNDGAPDNTGKIFE